MRTFSLMSACLLLYSVDLTAQRPRETVGSYDSVVTLITRTALGSGRSYAMLHELTTGIGHRPTGSPEAARAVAWAKKTMEDHGLDSVWLEPVMVPRWVRGPSETAYVIESGSRGRIDLHVTALGRSVKTTDTGITAEIIEVKSFEDLRRLKDKARGKIVFFNRPMDASMPSTFDAYYGAVIQRSRGAIEAAQVGGVAALVRSVTTRIDSRPHTGIMNYLDTIPKIPAAAIATSDADMLSNLLKKEPKIKVHLKLFAEALQPVESANVIGELRGTERPDEVVLVSAHLDSWDVGQGAHDDAAGCVHAIQAFRVIKELNLHPKRTIRLVLFMGEETDVSGAKAYATRNFQVDKHIAAIESDRGGFSPRGFGVGDSVTLAKISKWAPLFRLLWADRFILGSDEADIEVLEEKGIPRIGLITNDQVYFDYHHSQSDVVENVNERELSAGVACLAILAYVLAQEGL